jgi:hypothetical protein
MLYVLPINNITLSFAVHYRIDSDFDFWRSVEECNLNTLISNKVNAGPCFPLNPCGVISFLMLVLEVALLLMGYSPAEFGAVEKSCWMHLRMFVALPNISNKK